MSNKNSRLIVVSNENYEILRRAGTITDSFNSVISKLIKDAKLDENVAMTRGTLAGHSESKAIAPQPSSPEGDSHG
jgi:predicted CopG family antitoxin